MAEDNGNGWMIAAVAVGGVLAGAAIVYLVMKNRAQQAQMQAMAPEMPVISYPAIAPPSPVPTQSPEVYKNHEKLKLERDPDGFLQVVEVIRDARKENNIGGSGN